MGRNGHRSKIIAAHLAPPSPDNRRVSIDRVRITGRLAVNKNLFIPDRKLIALNRNNPFDKILAGVLRKDKNNYIATLGLFKLQNFFLGEGDVMP